MSSMPPSPASPPALRPVSGATSGQASGAGSLEIKFLIESLLFVADGPVTVERLAAAIGAKQGTVEDALQELSEEYEQRGLRLQRTGGQMQIVTAPEAAPHIERFLGLELNSKLSAPALETLAIVAYQQPITRAGVETLRGVNCDSVLRTLVSKGLIEPVGRLPQAGRPIVYGTTFEFLQYFGLQELADLPPLDGGKRNES
jgi:segregation and condensation protein B